MRYGFPQLFNIDGSSRHEVVLISAENELDDIKRQIECVAADSPNCAEFMSKYKKGPDGDNRDRVGDIRVRWSHAVGRDPKTWPVTTTLTDENFEAVMRLIESSGVGKDVLEVRMEKVDG